MFERRLSSIPAHASASARSPNDRYSTILPSRNTKPSANRPPCHSVEPFRRTQACRYTTSLSPFSKNPSGSQLPSAQCPASLRDVRLHFRNAAIGPCGRKAFGFDAHDPRIEILDDGPHVVAIDRSEEVFE